MNGYDLSRQWFDFCFENPEKISPNHTALYFFCIEHCNRLGWKEKFGLPMEMAKEAIGVKNYRTYSKTFNELIEFGFIKLIQKSKNQYSSNIIAIVKNTNANTKALDKAMIKHSQKQGKSIVGIDKQETINKKTKKQEYEYSLEREILNNISQLFDSKYYDSDSKKKKWLDTIRLLINNDGHSKDTIVNAIHFARNDDFWSGNLISIPALRKKNDSGVMKIDSILAKMPKQHKPITSKYPEATYEQILTALKSEQLAKSNIAQGIKYIMDGAMLRKIRQDDKGYYFINDKAQKTRV